MKIKIFSALIIILMLGKLRAQDGVWPGLDLGTLNCAGSPYAYTGNTSGSINDCSYYSTGGDHIYQFTISTQADVTIDLCGSGFDTYLLLYNITTGGCGVAPLASNDDSPCGLQSTISQTGLAAGTYVVVIEGYSGVTGAYNLNIAVSNCSNSADDPCVANSIIVGCNGSKVLGNNTGMTDSGISAPSCGSYAGGDLWYSLVVPASGTIKIETYPLTLTDVGMAVYSTSGGCSGTLTEIACNDNSGFGNMAKITLYGQTSGATLYIRVWDKNNDQTGTFEIDASDLVDNYCVTNDAIDQGDGCAQLTDAINGQQGSIWDSDDKLNFTADWTYDFTVNLGNSDGGADGICFVIQNDPSGLTAVGAMGGSMGSGGITNSLIIEIDTYLNTEDRNDGLTGIDCWSASPDPDHLDIWLNGNVNPGDCSSGARVVPNAVELTTGGSLYNIENGLDHTLRINYVSGSQTITAEVLNLAGTISYGLISYSPVNPLILFGTNAPYFGFTGSTGGLNNLQTACLAATLVLPVQLTEFEVSCLDGNVVLNWSTSTEINNNYFTIERSTDGVDFKELGTVNGAGNSNNTLKYNWADLSSYNGMAYYRIKQTDYDGRTEIFEMRNIQCFKEQTGLTISLVNESGSKIVTEFETDKSGNYIIEIKDVTGRTLTTLDKYFDQGRNHVELFSSDLSNGMYFISINNENISAIKKFIVQ